MSEGFVKFGDTLVIESDDNCFLSVDPILHNVIWELPPLGKSMQPSFFANCQWRITARLSYIDDEMYKNSLQKGGRRQSSASLSSNYAYQSKQEAIRNEYDIENNKGDVLYGMIVQLQHVATGLFLAGLRTSSLDSDCFQLKIEAGSANCYFKIAPMYKIRTEGSHVVSDDEILFGSLSIAKHFVHKSSRVRPNLTSHGVLYDECNLSRSSAFSKMSLKIFSRTVPYKSKTLCTTQATRFLDCESNAFLRASCDLRMRENENREACLLDIPANIPFASHPDAMTAEALWSFESVGRQSCRHMDWMSEYRIKHVATNLYLTVVKAGDSGAESKDDENSAGYELLLRPQEHDQSSQTFSILCMQPTGELVQSSDVMVQLRHSVSPTEYLYVRKSHREKNSTTGGVFLSSQATSYDAFMIMDVKAEIAEIVIKLSIYYQVAVSYSHYFVQDLPNRKLLPVEKQREDYVKQRSQLAGAGRRFSTTNDNDEKVGEEEMKTYALRMLKNLLFDIVIGDQDEEDTNIYKMDGFCDTLIQNFCREQRIMEALLTMAVAPVQLGRIDAALSNGNVGSRFPNEPLTFKSIHMLVWNVIKHLYKGNFASEMYFVENIVDDSLVIDELEALIAKSNGNKKKENSSFAMERIINQIPFRLGASNALTVLISNNRLLLERFVNAELLVFFRDLISEWGPVSNFMGVFRAICSCQNQAIAKNQNLCIDIIRNSTDATSFLVSVEDAGVKWPKGAGNNPMNVQGLTRGGSDDVDDNRKSFAGLNFNPMTAIASAITSGDTAGASEVDNEPYFGSNCETEGFPKVYVSWVSSDNWVSQSDTFYFSPEKIGIKTETIGNKRLVALEDLCFPEKFEEGYNLMLTPTSMVKDASQMDSDIHDYYRGLGFDVDQEAALEMYLNHEKLALYFKEQVNFMAEMCLGRNQEAKMLLSSQFSFDVIFSCMCNVNLPFGIRSAFTNIMLTLVVDQFPHQDNCGRNKIPFSVYQYSKLEDKNISDDDALPRFSIPLGDSTSGDEMYRYITPKKLEFLVCFCARYLSNCNGQQISAPGYRERNLCNLSVLKLARKLLMTGFYDTAAEIENAVKPAMLLLDGRNMYEDTDQVPLPGMMPESEVAPGCPRYKRQDETVDIIAAKQSILGMFQYVKGLRGQYRLEKFLHIFKEYKEYLWSMDKVVEHVLELLAESGLNLDTLSGLPYTDTIFVDLMMYEDEDLFQQVLTMLLEEHEPAKALTENAHDAFLITSDAIDPPMLSFQHLNKCIFDLTFLFERPETWGIGKLDPVKFQEAMNLLLDFRRFLYNSGSLDEESADEFGISSTEPTKQSFLFSLNLQNILMRALQWDIGDLIRPLPEVLSWKPITKTPLPQNCSMHEVVARAAVILHDMVCPQRRTDFAKAVPQIMESIDKPYLRGYILRLVFQIYRGSIEHVSSTPVSIFHLFSSLLSDSEYQDLALAFFEEQLCPTDHSSATILRNQDIACHELQEQVDIFAVDQSSSTSSIAKYISMLNLLSACCDENSHNSDAVRFVLPAKMLLKRISSLLFVIKAHKIDITSKKDEKLSLLVALLDSYCHAFISVYLDEISFDEEIVNDSKVMASIYECLCVLYSGLFGDANSEFSAVVCCDSILELVRAILVVASGTSPENQLVTLLAHQFARNITNTITTAKNEGPRKSVLLNEEVSPFWSTTIVLSLRILVLLDAEPQTTLDEYIDKVNGRESKSAILIGARPARVVKDDFTSRKKLVLDKFFLLSTNVNTLPPPLTKFASLKSVHSVESTKTGSASFLPEIYPSKSSELVWNEKVGLMYNNLKGYTIQALRSSGMITCEAEIRAEQVATPFAEGGSKSVANIGMGFLKGVTDGAIGGLSAGFELGSKGLSAGLELGTMGLLKQKRASAGLMKDLDIQNAFSEFIEQVVESDEFQECIRREKMKVISILRSAKETTDPVEPRYVENYAAAVHSGESGGKKRRMSGLANIQGGLKNIAKLATFQSSASGTTERRRTKITWKDLIARMVTHIDYKNSRGEAGDEGSVCSRILDLFILYLDDAGDCEDAKYVERQDELNGFNLPHLVYRLLKSPGKGPLFEKALELGSKLLSGGHRGCQNSILQYMRSSDAEDSDGQFFKNIFDTITDAAAWTRKMQLKQINSKIDENEKLASEIEIVITIFRFLQGLCEGHVRLAQDCLREQPFNRRNYDIIGVANDLMEDLAPRRDIVKAIGYSQYCLLTALLDFVIDCVQGPCPQNQMICVEKKAIEVCKQLITTIPTKIQPEIKHECRFKAICLLAALVEGRHDGKIERMLNSKIEMALFDEVESDLRDKKAAVINYQAEKRKNRPYISRSMMDLTSSVEDPYEMSEAFSQVIEAAMTNYYKIKVKLSLEAEKMSGEAAMDLVGGDDNDSALAKQMKKQMCEVEILWNDKIERVVFPIPPIASKLSETTKSSFLNTCDLSSRESRIKELMDNAEDFFDEMRVYHRLAQFPLYAWLLDNYFYFKSFILIIVSMLVINVMFSYNGKGHNIRDTRNGGSLLFSVILTIIAGTGYFVLVLYWALPRIALSLFKHQEQENEDSVHGENEEGGDSKTSAVVSKKDENVSKFRRFKRIIRRSLVWRALKGPIFSFPALWIMFLMHYAAFVNEGGLDTGDLFKDYTYITIVIYSFWIPISVRNGIGESPKSIFEELYVLIYDTLMQFEIYEHLGCLLCLFFGAGHVALYSIVLLDWISLSEHMKNVVRSVMRPFKALFSVFLLFVFVIVIFAVVGFFSFDNAFLIIQSDIEVSDGGGIESTPDVYCTSVMSCFWTLAYGAVRAGDIAEVMDEFSPYDGSLYYSRLLFDMTFFIVLGVLLFDMVTGIIVDTFVALREETSAREEVMTNEVFISGITQEMCTDKGLSFVDHQEKFQKTWNYIYYYAYLRLRNKNELDGPELYVWECINNKDCMWFPRMRSIAMETAGAAAEDDKFEEISDRLGRLERMMEEIMKAVKA